MSLDLRAAKAKWRHADRHWQAWGHRASRAARDAFPVGLRVYWEHGDHIRSGVVIHPTKAHGYDYHHARVCVETRHTPRQWIAINRLLPDE